MESDHSYHVKHKLRQSRLAASSNTNTYLNIQSPFRDIKSVPYHGNLKASIGHLGHFVKGFRRKNDVFYPITSYKQAQGRIPPYHAYISTKRNVLTEDDNQRTFLPHYGAGLIVEDTDEEYAAFEQQIEYNQIHHHNSIRRDDHVRMYRCYAEAFLEDIGCRPEAVLQYLINESPRDVPEEIPAKCKSLWYLRTDYLQEDYYELEDHSGSGMRTSSDQMQPQVQWRQLSKRLAAVENLQLAKACIACKVFLKLAGFSLFHMLQEFGKTPQTDQTRYSLATYTELECLICKAHECPGHGQYHVDAADSNMRERVNYEFISPVTDMSPTFRAIDAKITSFLGLQDDGDISGSPWTTFRQSGSIGFKDTELCSDDCFWAREARVKDLSVWSTEDSKTFDMLRPAYEHERRGACLITQCGLIEKSCKEVFLKLLLDTPTSSTRSLKIRNELDEVDSTAAPRRTIDQRCNDPTSEKTWRQDARDPFLPCNHLGSCTKILECSCLSEGIQCEKSCACPASCTMRFQGCRCHGKGQLCTTKTCDCYRLNRECDPDLCTSCESEVILDPSNRYGDKTFHGKCRNVSIQLGVPRRTLLGPSALMANGGLCGWGLYMGESCEKGGFIGEYRGEVISNAEADRRGVLYDRKGMTYLFTLNAVQTLDSALIGNKLRFINHQTTPMANCAAKLMLCHGVARIGIFAIKDIGLGEELFFDYGQDFASRFNLINSNADDSMMIESSQAISTERGGGRRQGKEKPKSHSRSTGQLRGKGSKFSGT